MIVDSSAVLAILFAEEDSVVYADVIAEADGCRMSVVNWVEMAIRIDLARDPIASNAFDDFMREASITVEPVNFEQAQMARRAYLMYGEGRHPARLNFGDGFAYALSKITGEQLLFIGFQPDGPFLRARIASVLLIQVVVLSA